MSELIDDAKAYVRYVMSVTGLSATALAKKAGMPSTTLTRPLNDPEHKFSLSNTTVQKIAEATGITLAAFLARDDRPEVSKARQPLTSAPVVAIVEAGAWREVDEFDQSDPEWVSLPPDEKFPNATQEIYLVSGDSMNALEPHPITPGSRIVAVRYDEIAGRSPLRDGLIVVVQRTRDGGHVRELSVKQVAWFDDRIEFQPRSTNPRHKPIVVKHDDWEENGVVVEVLSLVRRIMHELPS
jgi:hypothetical protein